MCSVINFHPDLNLPVRAAKKQPGAENMARQSTRCATCLGETDAAHRGAELQHGVLAFSGKREGQASSEVKTDESSCIMGG